MVRQYRFAALGGLTAVTVLLGIACGGDDDPTPPAATIATEPTSTASPTPAEATAEPTPAVEPTPTAAPSATATRVSERATSYADMTFAVTNVVESNETWRTYGRSETQESDDNFLYVHLSVGNPRRHLQLVLESSIFFLDTGGERIEALRPWSQASSTLLKPGETSDYITGFRVPDGFDPADSRLVIAEAGRVPAFVSLQGTPEAPAYPIEARVEDEGSPVSAGSRCDDLTVDPVRAEIDVDAGIDGSGISGSVDGGRRARTGERFLRFDIVADGNASTCAIRDSYFRLEVDGTSLEPLNHVSTTVDPGETYEFSLAFRVPLDAREIVLHAGSPGGNVKPFPISVTDFGP